MVAGVLQAEKIRVNNKNNMDRIFFFIITFDQIWICSPLWDALYPVSVLRPVRKVAVCR